MGTAADCVRNNGGSLLLSVGGGPGPYSYVWNTSPVQPVDMPTNLGAGTYTVTISAPNACTLTASGTVETDFSCIGVYFPSAFTPGTNGRNDGFGPLGSLSSIKNYKLSVYNRWGERVFYSVNPFDKWDGKVKGRDTDGNLFVWQSEYNLTGQPNKIFRKGTILLIR
jgi:gliding motility-associated-like protein